MTLQHRITRILSTLLIAGLCSAPLLCAQQTNPSTAQQPPETSQQPATTQQPAQTNTTQPATTPAPAAAPAQSTQPAAPANQTQPQQQPSPNAAPAQTTTVPEGPKPKPQTEPVGAATAESVPTAGGAAAKPAGIAIAPAKQHQTRSLILKIGAVAAGAAALGTIFALSHGTSATPPGTGVAGVTGR
jgi:predicted component of type VI protein secretion system